ncbi:MAG: hypothetical protein NUK65_02395 [Firmicutes bacterium]|nr:hypothetical protein [Bacillota bacterium]
MFGAAAVSQDPGGSYGTLSILLILLPVLWLVARGVHGHLLARKELSIRNIFSIEFIATILYTGFSFFWVTRFRMSSPLTGTSVEGDRALIESITPCLIVLLPFLGAALVVVIGRRSAPLRNCVATATTFFTFVLVISMYPLVSASTVVYELPSLMGLGLHLRVDFFSFVFAAFSSFIWFLSTFYSQEYMEHEEGHTRYYFFMLVSLAGTVGVFLAGDLLSLFLFFETMTLASYALVIHAQSKAAMAAGRNYLYMGVGGGLCLLTAIMLVFNQTGTTTFLPNLEALVTMGSLRFLVGALFFIGFGIKAGAVPMHIWLPQSHPVAPTPASALLSGIMIKAGAYGIIRIFTMLFTPSHDAHSALWQITEQFGYILIWIGVITMFTAAVLALAQKHAKRVLAYSSVSQMGYILMGIGTAAYLGYEGAMGLGGVSYHILNHAFFKAGMFLMVGAVYMRTHDLDYSKLGGLWRSFPVTAVAFLVAAFAIAGVPGFNGYISKTMLHHAIVEAGEHHGALSLLYAEKIFVITGGLTFCYIMRLFQSIFLGKRSEAATSYKRETTLERVLFGIIATIIIYGGLASSRIINRVILPMGHGFIYDHHMWEHMTHLGFWNSHDLVGIGGSLGIGAIVFVLLARINFNLPLANILSVEHLFYKPFLNGLFKLFMLSGYGIEKVTDVTLVGISQVGTLLAEGTGWLDGKLLPRLGHGIVAVMGKTWDRLYTYVLCNVNDLRKLTQQAEWATFFAMIKVDYNPRGDKVYKRLTMMNLDLTLFIVLFMLALIFSLRFLTLFSY